LTLQHGLAKAVYDIEWSARLAQRGINHEEVLTFSGPNAWASELQRLRLFFAAEDVT